MAYAVISHTSLGGTDFAFSFPYLNEQHIEVRVNGQLKANPADYTIIAGPIVRFGSAVAVGAIVEIRRVTTLDAGYVDFVDASSLTEDDLDRARLQSVYAHQEASDLRYPARWEYRSTLIAGASIPISHTVKTVIDNSITIYKAGVYRLEVGASIQRNSGAGSPAMANLLVSIHAGPLGTVSDPLAGGYQRTLYLDGPGTSLNLHSISGTVHDVILNANDILTFAVTRTGDAANSWNVLKYPFTEAPFPIRAYRVSE